MVTLQHPPSARTFTRHVGEASRVELDYFCRTCKGHYSSTIPVGALRDATCRCGSHDILVYSMVGDASAPLRGR